MMRSVISLEQTFTLFTIRALPQWPPVEALFVYCFALEPFDIHQLTLKSKNDCRRDCAACETLPPVLCEISAGVVNILNGLL